MILSEEDGIPVDERANAVMPKKGHRRDAQSLEILSGGLGLARRFSQHRKGSTNSVLLPGATQQNLPRSKTNEDKDFDQITTGQ